MNGVANAAYLADIMEKPTPASRRLAILRGHLLDAAAAAAAAAPPSAVLLSPSPCTAYDTAAHQATVPRLPLPALSDTMQRYLDSVRPLATPAEFAATKACVADFLAGPGPRLQAELKERDRQDETTSYIKPFWDDMYLGGRYPIPINSNPGCGLSPDPACEGDQARRSASLVCASAQWYQAFKRGQITPDGHGTARPRCMAEYSVLFGTSRIPHLGRDRLRTYDSRHAVVLRGGDFYSLDILSEDGHVIPEHVLERQIAAILSSTPEPTHGQGRYVSSWDAPRSTTGTFPPLRANTYTPQGDTFTLGTFTPFLRIHTDHAFTSSHLHISTLSLKNTNRIHTRIHTQTRPQVPGTPHRRRPQQLGRRARTPRADLPRECCEPRSDRQRTTVAVARLRRPHRGGAFRRRGEHFPPRRAQARCAPVV